MLRPRRVAVYESERAQPAVQDLTAKYDPARAPAVQEREGDGAPGVRLGDLGGPVVEDPAAPRSTTPAAREGEDIGTRGAAVRDHEPVRRPGARGRGEEGRQGGVEGRGRRQDGRRRRRELHGQAQERGSRHHGVRQEAREHGVREGRRHGRRRGEARRRRAHRGGTGGGVDTIYICYSTL